MGIVKRTPEQWLQECPHHIMIQDVNLDAIDWLLETLNPHVWHHQELKSNALHLSSLKKVQKDLFAFKNKSDAVLFKLMWWKP